MRIAIFSTCPGGDYAAGSYHGLMAGYCLARRGHDVYFVTDHRPAFDADLRPISPENPITIVLTKDFEVFSDLRFDHVIVAPQRVQDRRVCMNAIRIAEHNQAALSFFCFGSADRPEDFTSHGQLAVDWSAWHLPVSRGALILCDTEESQRDAQEHFPLAHPETAYAAWQPPINQPARAAAQLSGPDGDILIFARPMGGLTDADAVVDLLVSALQDYRFVIVIDDPRGAEAYCTRLQDRAAQTGNQILFRFCLSDVERFEALDRASALVVPRIIEGQGYPLIEALATNTPCIAYDLPGLRLNCGEPVRYVAPGDVGALRSELISARQDPPPPSAERETLLLRCDIDLRAKALEDVLEAYRQQRGIRRTPSAKALGKLRADATTPEQIRLGNRLVTHFMVSTAHRISAAVFSGERPATCHVVPAFAVNGAILHHFLIETALHDDEGPAWMGGKLYLTFHGQAGAVVDLPARAKDLGSARAFSPSALGAVQRNRGDDGMSVLAWALPAQDYDAALWLSFGDGEMQCLPGDIGLSVAGYGAKTGIARAARCGIGFYLPESRTLAESNHLLLLRNGAIVFSSEIPEAEIAAADLNRAVDISLPEAGPNAPENLFRARCYRSPDRVQILGWTNALDRVVTVEVREVGADPYHMRVVTKFSLNADRPDVAEQYGISRNDVGFSCVLPPQLTQGEYAIAFTTRGREIHQIAQMKVDADSIALPVMKSGKLLVSLSEELHEGSVPVVRRPPRQEIERFTYAPLIGTLTVKGWLMAKGRVKVTLIEAETLREVGSISKLVERADIAAKFGTAFCESGFQIECQVERPSRAGYLLQVSVGKVAFEPDRLPVPQIAAVTEFAISDCQYEPQWRSLWLRGSFVCPGIRLSGIEIWQGDQILCTGTANIKQALHGDLFAGWRVEAVLDRPLDLTEDLEVRGITTEGAIATTRFAPGGMAAAQPLSDLDEDVARLGLARTFRKRVAPPGLDLERAVLVVVHDLDAIERRDKLSTLVSLRAALAERGLQLVVFHHGRGGLSGDLPEINVFDPFFDLLRQIEGADLGQAVRKVLPQKRLSAMVGSLHGLLSSRSKAPPDWAACSAVIEDEVQRLFYVLRALNPRHVLLWGQTPLIQIGRGLCQGMGLPSACLREGMLPKTMLYDQCGVAAQANCSGATITRAQDGPTIDEAGWLEQAETAIATLREDGTDQHPVSDLPMAAAARAVADGMGAKLIFYAGTDEWQAGALPESDDADPSPHFRDSGDGLRALLDLAESQNWLILFKPHPDIYPRPVAVHSRLFVVREGSPVDCVDLCDVVVTLRSLVSYVSLARGKATVLLGQMVLSGTGSAYEITARGNLAEVVSRAIGQVELPHQLRAFRYHVAALLQDQLYCLDPADTLAVRSHADLADRVCSELGLAAPEPSVDEA